MKKQLLVLISFVLISCGGVKKTENAISSGNYDQAFDNAVQRLNKDKSKNAKQIPLLKEAYDKANQRDLAEISKLKGKTDTKSLERLLKKYQQLDVRQDEIILLEPLSYDGKTYQFKTKDYANDIAKAKKKYADNLYATATPLMYGSKTNARKAFKILEEIQVFNPNYKADLNAQILATKKRGMDFVFVVLHNNVAAQLQDSTSLSVLKNFASVRTGDFNNKWVEMHNVKDYNVVYDYQADVYLDKITAIPEKLNTQVVPQEKKIQTGVKARVDANGKPVVDKNGNAINDPVYKTAKATVTLFQQIKSTVLDGKVVFKNLKTGAVINTTPLNGEAKLENVYGTYKGEPKVIDKKYHEALNNTKKQFPEDSAFNKFALQTFKQKVEELLAQQKY